VVEISESKKREEETERILEEIWLKPHKFDKGLEPTHTTSINSNRDEGKEFHIKIHYKVLEDKTLKTLIKEKEFSLTLIAYFLSLIMETKREWDGILK
jgi:hypothetical protein